MDGVKESYGKASPGIRVDIASVDRKPEHPWLDTPGDYRSMDPRENRCRHQGRPGAAVVSNPAARPGTAKFLHRLLVEDQSGVTVIEYGFLICLIAVAMISSLHLFSNQLNNTFQISTNGISIQP